MGSIEIETPTIIDLLHNTCHLRTWSRIDGKKAMSCVNSGGGGGGREHTSHKICLVIKVKYVLSLQMRQQ